ERPRLRPRRRISLSLRASGFRIGPHPSGAKAQESYRTCYGTAESRALSNRYFPRHCLEARWNFESRRFKSIVRAPVASFEEQICLMPKRTDISKILILGSGPIII